MALERDFRVGQFGIVEGCIGIGTGGGFTQSYHDLVMEPDGGVHAITFQLPARPHEYDSRRLGALPDGSYASLRRALNGLELFDTAPDTSSTLASYVFAATADGRVHAVTSPDLLFTQNRHLAAVHAWVRGLALFLAAGSPPMDKLFGE